MVVLICAGIFICAMTVIVLNDKINTRKAMFQHCYRAERIADSIAKTDLTEFQESDIISIHENLKSEVAFLTKFRSMIPSTVFRRVVWKTNNVISAMEVELERRKDG
jgi:hypothetical protein